MINTVRSSISYMSQMLFGSTRSDRVEAMTHLPFSDENVVGNWEVGKKIVTLAKEQELLAYYTYQTGETKFTRNVMPQDVMDRYGMKRALHLIEIFHHVIQASLEDHISYQAFLPLLCKGALNQKDHKPANMQVALFGQYNGVLDGSFIGARYAVYDLADRVATYYTINRESSDVLEGFLQNFPLRNEKTSYEKYVKYFKPTLLLEEKRVASISLECISKYDSKVIFNTEQWAITVISARGIATGVSGYGYNTGHAMIACEGFKNGRPFLKYAHITKNDDGTEADKKRGYDEARVELSLRQFPLPNTSNGPTWVRSKDLVEKMLKNIEEAQKNHRYVKFSVTRDAFDSSRFFLSQTLRGLTYIPLLKFGVGATIGIVSNNYNFISYASYYASMDCFRYDTHAATRYRYLLPAKDIDSLRRDGFSDNCASWVRKQLENAEIYVKMPATSITPESMIDCLKDEQNVIFRG